MRGTLQRIDADVIQVCRAYHVEKQALVTYDPFSVEQRMLTTVSITSEMEALLRAVDAQHIRLVLDAFDGIDWGNLTETQLEARLARIAAILPDRSAMSAGVADLSAYLKREGREVFEATKGGFSNRYNISLEASFNRSHQWSIATGSPGKKWGEAAQTSIMFRSLPVSITDRGVVTSSRTLISEAS